VKKIAKMLPSRFLSTFMHNFFRGKNSPKIWPTYVCYFPQNCPNNNRPIGEKFAQSGHPDFKTWLAFVCKLNSDKSTNPAGTERMGDHGTCLFMLLDPRRPRCHLVLKKEKFNFFDCREHFLIEMCFLHTLDKLSYIIDDISSHILAKKNIN
jgi:hypothetical protein